MHSPINVFVSGVIYFLIESPAEFPLYILAKSLFLYNVSGKRLMVTKLAWKNSKIKCRSKVNCCFLDKSRSCDFLFASEQISQYYWNNKN